MKPQVSVICSTFRPGGIDITLAGMRDQTYKNFELVLIDKRYDLRYQRVVELARYYGVRLVHAPEYRRNGKWVSFCSAWNTGMALARGEVLILFQDWQYAPPGWIEAHLQALDGKRRYVLAPYIYTELPAIQNSNTAEIQVAGEENCVNTNRLCVDSDPRLEPNTYNEIQYLGMGCFLQRGWVV